MVSHQELLLEETPDIEHHIKPMTGIDLFIRQSNITTVVVRFIDPKNTKIVGLAKVCLSVCLRVCLFVCLFACLLGCLLGRLVGRSVRRSVVWLFAVGPGIH
jgi:hypothetical protein